MKNMLLLGAGRSAAVLISYLLEQVATHNWHLTIADVTVAHLELLHFPEAVQLINLNIEDKEKVEVEVGKADLIISLLPAFLHPVVARLCLTHKKDFLTASYVSPEIADIAADAKAAGLLFMMEAGLDPGIDHMSALVLINRIKHNGGELLSFKSYTGGLIAPKSDNNPWHYKFTWNPRNVVLAGQGTAKYLENGTYKYIPYHQLFNRAEKLEVLPLGLFEGYANRDSLLYREPYGLQQISTIIRGTLRRAGFCQAWHLLVQLGLTDDSYTLENSASMTYREFVESYLPAEYPEEKDWIKRIAKYLNLPATSETLALLSWLEFPEEPIGLDNATPARILEKLLLQKWRLQPDDKDMVVMQHIFEYKLRDEVRKITSSLVVMGEDAHKTAMAKTVGLPVGIIAKLMLQKKIMQTGVVIPTTVEIYEPVLQELEQYGIKFIEKEEIITQQGQNCK